jgi:penicillin-insensitive murein DD-endopeptidase
VYLRGILCVMLGLGCGAAAAQAQDLPEFRSLFASRGADTKGPAKALFGAATSPAPLAAEAIGSYSRGCLAGAVALPVNGRNWQVMRLSRNRNWGHPRLIAYLERLAEDARAIGWPGLLVGDMAQPRGGPMLTGHSSHQIGLDADIWLTPMPDRRLSRSERENMSAVSMLRDPLNVDRDVWTPTHTRLIGLAASYREVERIFVHPAIKQALCDQAGRDRAWLSKVRPWWGHYYHFHVRIACPRGSPGCRGQKEVAGGDGCGAELDGWFQTLLEAERDRRESENAPAARPLTLADLPNDCRTVLASGGGVARVAKPAIADKPAGPPPPRLQFGSHRDAASFGLGD